MPGPQFRGLDQKGSANHAYYVWVDRYNILGRGANVPIACANGGESLLALVNGEFVTLRVPYPLGFFTKNVDGRIDDAFAGWKGRGIWTTSGTRANLHGEGARTPFESVQGADAARPAGALIFVFNLAVSARCGEGSMEHHMRTTSRRDLLAVASGAAAAAITDAVPAAAGAGPKPIFEVPITTIPIVGETGVFQVRRHHEVELVAALRSGGTNIPPEKALDHLYGYALGLDMTRRDLQNGMAAALF